MSIPNLVFWTNLGVYVLVVCSGIPLQKKALHVARRFWFLGPLTMQELDLT